jgi:ZIP family zinc transporter
MSHAGHGVTRRPPQRLIFFHVHHEDRREYMPKSQHGILGAGSLSIHSFLDGVAIGLAFQTSIDTGIIVAVAVLVHDFSDGINTVNLILKNGGETRRALQWLILNAAVPVFGVLSTLFFTLPETVLGLTLALFSGFFLYIAAPATYCQKVIIVTPRHGQLS